MKALLTFAAALALASAGSALQKTKAKPLGAKKEVALGPQEARIAAQIPSYPFKTCVVSGEPLDSMDGPIDVLQDGKLVRLCCKGCKKALKKDPAKIIAKIDAAVVAQQKPGYALQTCPVSGETLADEDAPVDYVHGTRLVRFCCKKCVKTFQKDPAKYMASVDQALIQKQRASYPLETCVVSGEPLAGEDAPVDYLYGTHLVRFCCKKCVKAFQKDPAKFLAKLAPASTGSPGSKAHR